MGITTISAKVFNPADLSRFVELEFTVDSGAGHSVVPRSVLQELGIEPHTTKRFYMVDGQGIDRKMGGAAFEYAGERAYAPVIFGEEAMLHSWVRPHSKALNSFLIRSDCK